MKKILIFLLGVLVVLTSPLILLISKVKSQEKYTEGLKLIKSVLKYTNFEITKFLYKQFRYEYGEYKKYLVRRNIRTQQILDKEHNKRYEH